MMRFLLCFLLCAFVLENHMILLGQNIKESGQDTPVVLPMPVDGVFARNEDATKFLEYYKTKMSFPPIPIATVLKLKTTHEDKKASYSISIRQQYSRDRKKIDELAKKGYGILGLSFEVQRKDLKTGKMSRFDSSSAKLFLINSAGKLTQVNGKKFATASLKSTCPT